MDAGRIYYREKAAELVNQRIQVMNDQVARYPIDFGPQYSELVQRTKQTFEINRQSRESPVSLEVQLLSAAQRPINSLFTGEVPALDEALEQLKTSDPAVQAFAAAQPRLCAFERAIAKNTLSSAVNTAAGEIGRKIVEDLAKQYKDQGSQGQGDHGYRVIS